MKCTHWPMWKWDQAPFSLSYLTALTRLSHMCPCSIRPSWKEAHDLWGLSLDRATKDGRGLVVTDWNTKGK